MTALEEARTRVDKWLVHITTHSGYEGSVLHRACDGVELRAEDLEALVRALEPEKPSTPRLGPVKERVRRYDRQTSWDAALSITPETTALLYRTIYSILNWRNGLTDEELVYEIENTFVRDLKATPSGIRSRRAELVRAGWVLDSGETRPGTSGRQQTVWLAASDI